MTSQASPGTGRAEPLPIPFREFIGLLALLMAMTALSIDIMLPALPDISREFALANQNDRQLVVAVLQLDPADDGFAIGRLQPVDRGVVPRRVLRSDSLVER